MSNPNKFVTIASDVHQELLDAKRQAKEIITKMDQSMRACGMVMCPECGYYYLEENGMCWQCKYDPTHDRELDDWHDDMDTLYETGDDEYYTSDGEF